ncbi:hypothetical protein ZIOFF_049762 [Zingiber officinale]|uniref:C2H2-type domain-containing protein n=1 Tax=Zingiber officinale TaxID=94328 RepID=A0A8J5FJB4_ZINOF|nr:hypothetical protein ZIOFF_049762 [Zingiber officinale]
MKRFSDRVVVEDEEAEIESVRLANVLMLLSRGGEGIIDVSAGRSASPDRVFECKTCNRQFSSFQALGGHRASHKKPRLSDDARGGEVGKPRAHECSVCGLEFAIGQALGGHMRRHRTGLAAAAAARFDAEKKAEERLRGLWLDLNVPPADGEGGAVTNFLSPSRIVVNGFVGLSYFAPPLRADSSWPVTGPPRASCMYGRNKSLI